jgi:hypothetical protein
MHNLFDSSLFYIEEALCNCWISREAVVFSWLAALTSTIVHDS